MLFDVVNGIAYSANLFGLVIGNGDAELFLKLHDELYRVQRICAQIISEAGFVSNFGFFYAQFINDNFLYFNCSYKFTIFKSLP